MVRFLNQSAEYTSFVVIRDLQRQTEIITCLMVLFEKASMPQREIPSGLSLNARRYNRVSKEASNDRGCLSQWSHFAPKANLAFCNYTIKCVSNGMIMFNIQLGYHHAVYRILCFVVFCSMERQDIIEVLLKLLFKYIYVDFQGPLSLDFNT